MKASLSVPVCAVLFAVTLFLPVCQADAPPATPITTCNYVVSAPGNYVLGANLTCPTTNGILIEASHVTLKLNGHNINGNSSSGGIVVFLTSVTLTDVHILGPGLIQNFGTNVVLFGTTDSEVRNVTSEGGGAGIALLSCSRVRLTGNVATFAALFNIGVTQSNNNSLEANVANSSDSGIRVQGGSYNTLEQNTAGGNRIGISIESNSTNNNLQNNTTIGNNLIGIILLSGSTANHLQENKSVGNPGADLQDGNPGCDSNQWRQNSFFLSNQPTCIH